VSEATQPDQAAPPGAITAKPVTAATPATAAAAQQPSRRPQRLLVRWGFSWQGLIDNRRGEWWLIAQVLLIAAHLLPAMPPPAALGVVWPPPLALLGWATLALGLLLAAQAFVHLGANLTPLPEPMDGAALVTGGAYARCRHPLYQAILICSLGLTLALGSLLHLALLLALAWLLASKARREERRLIGIHAGYADYRASTPAILPGVPGLDWR
jgi:protein-S-isoprenylcysteine O-methyltransferase Ste14